MLPLLFRNRWFALAWAGLTLASVSAFVGKDGGADMILGGIRRIDAQRKLLASRPPERTITVVRSQTPSPVQTLPQLQALPGSAADPAHPKVGEVFIDPVTGRRLRAVLRSDVDPATYSSTAALP